jgi:hypothetical protein
LTLTALFLADFCTFAHTSPWLIEMVSILPYKTIFVHIIQ